MVLKLVVNDIPLSSNGRASEQIVHPVQDAATVDAKIKQHIREIQNRPEDDHPGVFYAVDLDHVAGQYQRWQRVMPLVSPHYAVKCNNDNVLLGRLADLGAGFDCASIQEMQQVLSLGVDASRVLLSNPCKSPASIRFAAAAGITRTVIDNEEELEKISSLMPEAELLIRVYASDDSAIISFGDKYGATLDEVPSLLAKAKQLRLNVIGISFHVGTGASDTRAFIRALTDSKAALYQLILHGFRPQVLDIGGGFQNHTLDAMSVALHKQLCDLPRGIEVIAEPGRFFARYAFTLVTRIIARRAGRKFESNHSPPDMLYQSDGVFGNFMNVMVEKEVMRPYLISADSEARRQGKYRYVVWGPTCDSTDCVVRDAKFESEVKIGDWLVYPDMGAYTSVCSTAFNGIPNKYEMLYVCKPDPVAQKALDEKDRGRQWLHSDVEISNGSSVSSSSSDNELYRR